MKFGGSLARNDHFGSFFCEKVAEASHEMLVLEACSVKFGGSLARNDHFGSFFCEKVAEASHEMLVLEAFVILA